MSKNAAKKRLPRFIALLNKKTRRIYTSRQLCAPFFVGGKTR
jgi:hypothetical protein